MIAQNGIKVYGELANKTDNRKHRMHDVSIVQGRF